MLCRRAPQAACVRSSRQQLLPGPVCTPTARGLRSSSSSSSGRSRSCKAGAQQQDDDMLLSVGCPVPTEQQPMNELKQLQEMFLFDWATMPVQNFVPKLAAAWLGFYLLLGLPVSAFTFDVHKELVQCLAAASAGSSFVVTVLVWRLYLGWQHVGDRLISATVEYEETGWYDGQTWVKTPQVLMRDRLMSNYTVKPALARLKRTLLGLGGALVASMMLLAVMPPPPVNSASYYYAPDGSSSSSSYSAAVSSSSSGSSGGMDYEAAVSKYEPAAGADEDADAAAADDDVPRFDMRTHMMQQ